MKQLWHLITSLKLTVVCLSFSMLIVFVGTLAQVEQGLYLVQDRYFKSLFVFWGPEGSDWQIPIMPGGYLVGILLMINLIAAFMAKFKWTRKKIGICISHLGIILLLLGQLATDLLSRESAMEIKEGATSSHSSDFRINELVIIDQGNPAKDKVYALAESLVQSKQGAIINNPSLPFQLKIEAFWPNVSLTGTLEDSQGQLKADHADYQRVEAKTGFSNVYLKPMPPQTSMDSRDTRAAIIEVMDGGTSVGKWFVATILDPQTWTYQGREYSIGMRAKRYYEDFSMTLLKATHENYTGTNEPRNFASRVQLRNRQTGEDREVLIYMNHPLRYQGLTFYQYQMTAGEMVQRQGLDPSSTFQVVKNPTWVSPYLACVMVGLGLTIQFMIHLVGFLRKRRPNTTALEPSSAST